MDRESLALRNSRLAESLRQPTAKQRLRNSLLAAAARTPIRVAGADSERLLIIRPDHLGDALLSTPAIQALKRSSPNTAIHVLCSELTADAFARYPEVERVLTIAFPGFQRSGRTAPSPWRLALETARSLRRIGYASAIIMRPDHWWGALVAHLAGIERRVGYDAANVALFLSEEHQFQHQHAVQQNMRLVEAWTGEMELGKIRLDFPVWATNREFTEQKLGEWRLQPEQALVCFHPGSGRSSKVWHAENWAAVADELVARYNVAAIFTGTGAESQLINSIVDQMRSDAASVAGATSIGQLAALYERASAVMGPDSGALHLAAAVNTPTVALFGPADPVEFAPWGDPRRHRVVTSDIGCRPCRILDWGADDPSYHPCVRDISVEQVLAAADRVLSEGDR